MKAFTVVTILFVSFTCGLSYKDLKSVLDIEHRDPEIGIFLIQEDLTSPDRTDINDVQFYRGNSDPHVMVIMDNINIDYFPVISKQLTGSVTVVIKSNNSAVTLSKSLFQSSNIMYLGLTEVKSLTIEESAFEEAKKLNSLMIESVEIEKIDPKRLFGSKFPGRHSVY